MKEITIAKDVLIMIADKTPDLQGDSFDIDGVELPKEIMLSIEFSPLKPPIGAAINLRKKGSNIYADLVSIPEYKDVIEKLTPCVGGTVDSKDMKSGSTLSMINKFRLNHVALSAQKNADPRIKSISDQRKDGQ